MPADKSLFSFSLESAKAALSSVSMTEYCSAQVDVRIVSQTLQQKMSKIVAAQANENGRLQGEIERLKAELSTTREKLHSLQEEARKREAEKKSEDKANLCAALVRHSLRQYQKTAIAPCGKERPVHILLLECLARTLIFMDKSIEHDNSNVTPANRCI